MSNCVSHSGFGADGGRRMSSLALLAEFAIDDPDVDLHHDTAEICRAIERDGMIGLDGAAFDGE